MINDIQKKTNDWFESWWFKGIVGVIVIGLGVVDVVYWKSSIILAVWNVITTLLKDTGWQFIVLFSLLIFRIPISAFLINVSENLGRLKKLSIGENFTISSDELISALIDREVLKVSIQVAIASDGIDAHEQLYLLNRASPMKTHVQSLGDTEKRQVIEEAINIALMDNEIQQQEYVVIQDTAELYGMKSKDVDDMILKTCYSRKGTIPPNALKDRYNKEYKIKK